jgi:hypothetical protein
MKDDSARIIPFCKPWDRRVSDTWGRPGLFSSLVLALKTEILIGFYRPGTVFRTRPRGRKIGVLEISGDTSALLGDRGAHRTAAVTEFLQPAIYIYIYYIFMYHPDIYI